MKKHEQLGMNYSTASNRLVKDLLFDFVLKAEHKCSKCGGKLTRETFSIEHITPWLDSDRPLELFFDLDNIAYSHLSCNVSSARKQRAGHGTAGMYANGCKCDICRAYKAEEQRRYYKPEKRREKYLKHGY